MQSFVMSDISHAEAIARTGTILPFPDLRIVHANDLAKIFGYARATNGFRRFCAANCITPVPGRGPYYDMKLVRHRLDVVQGLGPAAPDAPKPSLVEQRRRRRGEH